MKYFFMGFMAIASVAVLADVEYRPLDIPEEACSKLGRSGPACFEAHSQGYEGMFSAPEKYRKMIEHYLTLECVPIPTGGAAFMDSERAAEYLNLRKLGKTCVWVKR